jgi:hypothetical protein
LMPIDGDPDDVAESGISTAQVSEWLRGCGADNVVMILDACRSGGRKDGKGIGDETREGCRQTGVISLFSCSPNQFSYELPTYQQGAFTKVLLEGLGVQGACATVARLDEYLKRRVPEVVRECLGNGVRQFPYSIAEPINKSHLILMPKHSCPEDLNALKMDAFRAKDRGDIRLAYQCWLRVNIASGGLDMEAIEAIIDLKPRLSQSLPITQTKADPKSELPLSKEDLGEAGPTQEQIGARLPTSKKGLDYSKLQELLKEQNWKDADQETCNLMNRIAGRTIKVRDLKSYPQDAIEKIDELWSKASGGKFGFLAQARIWREVNGDEAQFDVLVGWKLSATSKQKKYAQLTFDLITAEVGHFPAFFKSWGGGGWSWRGYLLNRASEFLKPIEIEGLLHFSSNELEVSIASLENENRAISTPAVVDFNTEITFIPKSIAMEMELQPIGISRRISGLAGDTCSYHPYCVSIELAGHQIRTTVYAWEEEYALIGHQVLREFHIEFNGGSNKNISISYIPLS